MELAMKRPKPTEILDATAPRLIGYARVSTSDQRLDLQLDALARAGVLPENVHKDTVSGARVTRKGLTAAMRDVRAGDTLIVWKLDRLGRSLPDLIKKMQELKDIGAGFRSLTEGIDTTTAMGTFVLHLMGAVAQFERDLTRERTSAGMRAAKERGQPMGAQRKLRGAKREEAKRLLLTSPLSVKAIAKRLKVSTGTIYNEFPGGRSGKME